MVNAAPEWQAKSLWGCSSEMVEACPLEGLVMPFESARNQLRLWEDVSKSPWGASLE